MKINIYPLVYIAFFFSSLYGVKERPKPLYIPPMTNFDLLESESVDLQEKLTQSLLYSLGMQVKENSTKLQKALAIAGAILQKNP